jgi:hypothetical protein
MKEIAVLLFVLFSASLIGQNTNDRERSQVDEEKRKKKCFTRFHLGLKMGVARSNVYDAHAEAFQAEPKYGFVGGVFGDIPLGRLLGIRPEVLFSQKGFRASGSVMGTPYDLIRTSSFIDVPLLLAIKPICPLTFFVGPQYSYLLHQTDVFAQGLNSSITAEEFSTTNYRRNIMSGVVGVDLNVRNLVIGVRYNADMMLNNGDGTSSTPRYKNTWIQGTIGFRIF